MNIYRNENLINRNAKIAQFTLFGGLLVLAGGMYLSFRYPDQFYYSLSALVFGFILSQVGIYFSNRWSRKPRPDEILDQALKGLDDNYSLFHFLSPISHLLVGPCGVWNLRTYHQKGLITYRDGRWRQKGGSLYMKIFAQESLGRPELEIQGDETRLSKFFNENLEQDSIPEIHSSLVFTNSDVEISLSEDDPPPAETIYVAKLKDLVRKYAKAKTLSTDKIDQIINIVH
ncbi:MAG: hypothetical protein ACK2U3_02320 [Anaerolineales bacterium]|jgi:hypothetical protein